MKSERHFTTRIGQSPRRLYRIQRAFLVLGALQIIKDIVANLTRRADISSVGNRKFNARGDQIPMKSNTVPFKLSGSGTLLSQAKDYLGAHFYFSFLKGIRIS